MGEAAVVGGAQAEAQARVVHQVDVLAYELELSELGEVELVEWLEGLDGWQPGEVTAGGEREKAASLQAGGCAGGQGQGQMHQELRVDVAGQESARGTMV